MKLRVVVVYPDLLGTYGDGGNGIVLAKRASWRGFDTELIDAPSDQALPVADIYCLGGGEDGPQVRAADRLREDGALARAAEAGGVVFAVCAGYQIIGREFAGAEGRAHPGLGLLDITTEKGAGPRAVGEIVVEPTAEVGLPLLTGFENHSGVTTIGRGAVPLGRVVSGIGNGTGSANGSGSGRGGGFEGAVSERVIGTYLHGPVLARNPALADLILTWALETGGDNEMNLLSELDDADVMALRSERLSSSRVRAHRRRSLRRSGRQR